MTRRIAVAALLAGTALAGPALGQTSDEVAALRAQLAALQAQLDRLEAQQRETAAEVQAVRAAPAGSGSDGGDGKLPGAAPAPEPSVVAERADRGVVLTLGGRVNAALLYAEQGDQDQFSVVDNDGSGSRFEFLAETAFGEVGRFGEFSTGVEIVISAEVNTTDEIDFGANVGNADEQSDIGDFRQAHWFVESERFGYLSIGQGDTAAEDTAHVDLSGTDFAGAGSDVDDIAGGLVFETDLAVDFDDDGLVDFEEDGFRLTEVDDFFDMQDGSRDRRILYVTPEFNGFALKASLANDEESEQGRGDEFVVFENEFGDDEEVNVDDGDDGGLEVAVGLEFEREFGEDGAFELEASYREERLTTADEAEFDDDGALDFATDELTDRFLVGSASLLLDNGLNLTLAGSIGDIDDEDEDATAVFAKIGYRADVFSVGETRFSLDYFRGRNAFDFGRRDEEGEVDELPTAQSVGLFAVQDLRPLNAELYAGYRYYDVDDVFFDAFLDDGTQIEAEVDALHAVITGARVRF